jgi:5'-deoxynucleotidase YfbR-like HD superfamily hydrolase
MNSKAWIDTYTGKHFYFQEPTANMICIEDIAHALSMLCRFGGHVKKFYSVAQHSVFVSEICPPELALEGLMHDATEAYFGDVVTPLKDLIPEYQLMENNLHKVINKKYKIRLNQKTWKKIKTFDKIALVTEKRDLKPNSSRWTLEDFDYKPHERVIVAVSPEEAENMFLKRFEELKRG